MIRSLLKRIGNGLGAPGKQASPSGPNHLPGKITATIAIAIVASLTLTLAPPAQAAHIHRFLKYFTLPESARPLGVGINQSTGEVYVSGGNAVYAFEPSGAPDPTHPQLTEVGGVVPYPFVGPFGVAVDNSAETTHGDIYVANTGASAEVPVSVLQFDSTGARTAAAPITLADLPPSGECQSGGSPGACTTGGLPPVVNNGFSPAGLAVGPNGNVYVADQANSAVDVFQPNGSFVFQLGGGQLVNLFNVAVDASGNAYVPQGFAAFGSSSGLIEFEPSGACVDSCTPLGDANFLTDGVAVDAEGNVYANSQNSGDFVVFNSSGEEVERFGTGVVRFAYAIAVNDASGEVYAADEAGARVAVFEGIVIPSLTILPVTNPGQTFGTLNGKVDPAGGSNVIECHFEYGSEKGNYSLGTLPCLNAEGHVAGTVEHPIESPTEVHAQITGLTTESTYHYRLFASNEKASSEGADHTFTPHAVLDVEAKPAAGVTSTSATLNGSFAGDGEDIHYYFEWGTEEGVYRNRTPTPPADAGSPSGPGATSVSANLTELDPGTTYYYRFVAIAGDGAGKSSSPNQEQFTTPPAPPLVSESAGDVHSESALLQARINPEGGSTTYHFEYGPADCASSSCTSTPVPDAELDRGLQSVGVSVQLSGLSPGTTYHFRVVATNSTETTDGPDRTFTTFPFLSRLNEGCPNALARQQTGAALLLDCRAYELVSAGNAGGYNVSSDLSAGEEAPFGGYPEAAGPPRVLYSIDHGAIPGTDHPTNKGSDPYVATRGEDGWTTEYVGVPANDPGASTSEPFSSLPSGAGAGLDAFAFGSPGGCSPCFEHGYTGIPVRLSDGELVQGMAGSLDPGPAAKPAGHIAQDLSADGTHFVFGSTSKFEPDGNEGEISIYDRDLLTDETHVVSKTPGGATMEEEGQEIAELAISADGSHILLGKLTGEAEGQKLYHLYINVGDSEETIDLTPGAAAGVRFDGMTSDGTRVFFSSAEHLTHEDEQHTGADIFSWSQKGEEEGQALTLISTGTEADASSCDPVANTLHLHWNTTGAQNCGDVAIGGGGGVASGDGTIYFLSPSLLDGSEEPQDGVKNAPNLYLAPPGQAPHFVATLESSLTGPLQSRHPFLRNLGSFTSPEVIATDSTTGDIYVLDTASRAIYKLNSLGAPVTGWRENGKLSLEGIIGIATDPSNGNLYVGEGGAIKEFTPAGSLIRSFSDGTNGFAHGIAVDAAGNLYVYGSFNHYIAKFTSTGEEIGTVLSNVSATAIAIDPANGDLFVDSEGTTVERYSINAAEEAINPKIIVTELSGAAGLAVDSAHDVYIDEGDQVLEFSPSGEEVTVPSGAGLLHGSTAVAVSSTGDVYVGNPSHTNLAEFGPSESSPNPRTDNPAVLDAVSEPETRRSADFQLTPSGRFAAFTTTLPLTGAESGGFAEVFRYDAATEKLDCVSCNPTAAQATGAASLAANGSSLTAAGQVFFNSEEALALRDSDNLTDVYQWEPSGTGTCSSESPTFSTTSGDCLGLLSTGSSPFNSKLLGASLNGTDAYFFTRDTLASHDENGELVKIYDAREGGGFFIVPEPPLCKSSDECHGAGTPPPPPPDFHRNFGEAGNEVTATKCKKGFVEKHGKCVHKPRTHKHTKHHHKRSTHHRGGKK